MFAKIEKKAEESPKMFLAGVVVLFIIIVGPLLSFADTAWNQTDWSGGDGQTNWLDATKFSSQTNIDTTTPGEFKLATTGGGGGSRGVNWADVFDGGNYDIYANYSEQTSDGGYIVAGSDYNVDTGDSNAIILKLDSAGSITWQKSYGDASGDYANFVKQTSDGGYIVLGNTFSFGVADYSTWVLKLNSSGDVVWQNAYEGALFNSIQETSDSGYVMAGQANPASFGCAANADAMIIKLDSSGNITWQKTYGGPCVDSVGTDNFLFIKQTSDGGYIVSGDTNSFNTHPGSDNDAWVLKLDSSGDITWQKTYDNGNNADSINSVEPTSDGGYIASGYTQSSGAGSTDAWVLKLDSSGGVTWQKTYGGTGEDSTFSSQQTSDGGYVVGGYTDSFGAGLHDAWIFKLNSLGTVVWQKTYGGADEDYIYSLEQTSDGGYVAAGDTFSFAGYDEVLVLKIGSDGTISNSCSLVADSTAVSANSASVSADSTATIGTPTASPVITFATPTDVSEVLGQECVSTQGFSQSNWVGGPGQTSWSDNTMFDSSTDVNYLTNNQLTLNEDTSVGPPNWMHTYTLGTDTIHFNGIDSAGTGYVSAGTDYIFDSPSEGIVTNVDNAGNILWSKYYAAYSGSVELNSIKSTSSDGGYIAAGTIASPYSGILIKMDSTGGITWSKSFGDGGTNDYHFQYVSNTADGGYVVAGYVQDTISNDKKGLVMKFDSTGNITWQKSVGLTDEEFYEIHQTSDLGYIVAGTTGSMGAGGFSDAWLVKLNSDGTTAWQNSYGNTSSDSALSVIITADGGYAMAGSSNYATSGGGYGMWMVKTDSAGVVEWDKEYDDNVSPHSFANSIQQDSNGNYFLSGTVPVQCGDGCSSGPGVIKIDSSGTLVFSKRYQFSSNNEQGDFFSSLVNSDGSLMVVGDFYGVTTGAVMAKISANGTITNSCSLVSDITVTSSSVGVTGAITAGGNADGSATDNSDVIRPVTDTSLSLGGTCSSASYKSVGELISSIFDAGSPVLWGPLTYSATEPAGTSLNFWVSVGGGAWQAVTDFISQTFGSSQTVAYKVQLNTTDSGATPTLTRVSVLQGSGGGGGYASSGTLTSSIYDSGNTSTIWGPLSYTATVPAGTSLTVEVSLDGGNSWKDVTNSSGENLGSSRTFQYRVTLDSSDINATPVFSDISIPISVTSSGKVAPVTCVSPQVLVNGVCTTPPPPPTCLPRPACLDAYPRPCMIAEPVGGWCSPVVPTCTSPQILINNVCVTPPPTCNPPKVLINNVCVPRPPVCKENQILVDNICVEKIPPVCTPRPACLDATPRPCKIAEPAGGWCPSTPPTTPPGENDGGGSGSIVPPPPFGSSSGGNGFSSFLSAISLGSILSTTRTITEDPAVKTFENVAVAIPAVTSFLALLVAPLSGIPLQNYFLYLFIGAFQFLGFMKKSKPWGTVYDSNTKRPLPYARVEILNEQMRKLQSTIADANGRYSFLVSGSMTNIALRAYLTKYDFPSQKEPSLLEQKIYPNIYRGGFINTAGGVANYDLPMDPRAKSLARNFYFGISSIGLNNLLTKTANVLFALGLLLGIANVFVHPGNNSYIIMAVLLLTFLLRQSGFKLKPFGLTKNAETNKPLPFGLVALHNQGGERMNFTVSDDIGRYFLLTPKGSYLLRAFTPSYISPTRTKEVPIVTSKGWISREIQI